MPRGPYTRIIIRRNNGNTEVIGRPGIHEAHVIGREFEQAGHGSVVAVRHESSAVHGDSSWESGRHIPPAGKSVTLGIHNLQRTVK